MLLRSRPAALVLMLIGSLCATNVVVAQDQPLTNFELVRDVASMASEQLVESMGRLNLNSSLSLRSIGSQDGSFLVENALSGVLARAGHEVRTRPDSTGPILEFEIVDLGVAYTRVRRNAWLGEKRVEREARARLFARLVDQSAASVLWADQVEARIIDEIRHEDLGRLEEKGSADYLKAELPPRRWNKVVEPVVVTGIVVGLIVLFFSNQNASN